MSKNKILSLLLCLLTLPFASLSIFCPASILAFSTHYFPGEHWEKVSRPEIVGWSSEKLELARIHADRIGSAAVMIVVAGKILDEWGDTSRKFQAHSMRKSLLNALYGIFVKKGNIDLNATLEDLGIDDLRPLTHIEKKATVRDLLRGRSGIYIPALSLSGSLSNPPRGSKKPGTYFQYNNWDFNVLGTIFERQTHSSIFKEFQRCIADPLQMEDFSVEDCMYFHGSHEDNAYTRHPAYCFRISTRDLARFGVLYFNYGRWQTEQIVPAEWITESLTPYSLYTGERTKYGYANWKIYKKGKVLPGGKRLNANIFWTSGAGTHRLYVIPWVDLVVVHRINSDLPIKRPSGDDVDRLLALILDARISDFDAALVEAVKAQELEKVEALVECGADVNTISERRDTPLHYAAQRNDEKIAQLLVDRGANVDAMNLYGETPLFTALYNNSVEVSRLLISSSSSVVIRSKKTGQTPLLVATSFRQNELIEELLEAGADVNIGGEFYNESPLMVASITGNVDAVKLFLDRGARINETSSNGRSAAMMAAALGHTEVLYLLEHAGSQSRVAGALLPLEAYLPPYIVADAKTKKPIGPLAVMALISRGSTIKENESNALLLAAIRGKLDIVNSLLENGGKVDLRHKDGWTALLLAAERGHYRVVEVLLRSGAEINEKENLLGQTALIWAAKGAHIKTVKVLLEWEADLNARDKYGGSALTRAANLGHADIVDILLEKGADVSPIESDVGTALIGATWGGHLSIIKGLLRFGANPNDQDMDGRTPLMIAVIEDNAKVVEVLLEAGAVVDIEDKFGQTAYEIANVLGRQQLVMMLRKTGYSSLR